MLSTVVLRSNEIVAIAGLVGFMGYGDLWGSESTVLIFYKSRAGIYGDLWVDRR